MNLLLAALAVLPQWGSEPVDPVDHLSPGGALRLHVESVERDGEGPGVYSLFDGDTERWRVELPFRLSDVWLGPDGGTFGCGVVYSPETYFELVVARLDPEGEVLIDERTTMRSPRSPGGNVTQRPLGLVPDPANDRIWVRVHDDYAPERFESWWGYQLSTGERSGTFEPERELRDPFREGKRSNRVDQAVPVPDTELVLIHWWTMDFGDYSRGYGADGGAFTLMDPGGAFVWGVDLRLDYTVEPEDGGEEADDALALELQAQDLILGVQPGGIFEVRHVRTNERVTYQARRDQDTWVVDELTRLPWVKPEPDPSAPAVIEHVEVSLEVLGRSPLADSERGQTALLQDARAWCIDREGDLLVVREDPAGGFERSRHDLETGESERVHLPELGPLPDGVTSSFVSWFDLGEDVWLATRMTFRGALDDSWIVDAKLGELQELTGLRAADQGAVQPSVEAVARLDSGALVLLVTYRFRSTRDYALLSLDPGGELLWSVGSDHRGPSMLFSPDTMTVVGGDLIVVLDGVRDQLQLFGADGVYQRTVDLEQAWGQESSNPSELRPDRRGGLLVSDFEGEPGNWRMDLEAGTSEPLDVAFEDGGQPEELTRYLRAAPDGGLWTTDDFQLLELDDHGAVVRSHDAPVSLDVIYDPGPPTIPGNGRIYLQDERTGSVHVWREAGERLHIAHLPTELLHAVETWSGLVVEPEGGVWAKLDMFELFDFDMDSGPTPTPWVRWDAEGAYVGRSDLQDSLYMGTDGERTWWWIYTDGPEVRTADGEPIGRIEQAPDGRWIKAVRDVSFAPDGRTWIWERLERPRRSDQPTTGRILVCGPDLEVEETWTLVMGDEPIGVDSPQHAGPWVLPSASQPLLLTMPSPGVWQAWDLVGLELADEARLGFSANGEELLLVDADLTLTRFALPSLEGE